ncbi:unnamed protein product [Cylicostephanus goldi]|uniref:Senescence domain-containing protein n=1 Tax=Cylicostephanus goldi TaxID=71465 RepID=A0A3P7QH31_CYLGO|nr:unnamed protein product [Cylicostephanus goldi]
MSYRTALLINSSRRVLACAESRSIHSAIPQKSIIKAATKVASAVANAAVETLSVAGKGVQKTMNTGFEQTLEVAKAASEALRDTTSSSNNEEGSKDNYDNYSGPDGKVSTYSLFW